MSFPQKKPSPSYMFKISKGNCFWVNSFGGEIMDVIRDHSTNTSQLDIIIFLFIFHYNKY